MKLFKFIKFLWKLYKRDCELQKFGAFCDSYKKEDKQFVVKGQNLSGDPVILFEQKDGSPPSIVEAPKDFFSSETPEESKNNGS